MVASRLLHTILRANDVGRERRRARFRMPPLVLVLALLGVPDDATNTSAHAVHLRSGWLLNSSAASSTTRQPTPPPSSPLSPAAVPSLPSPPADTGARGRRQARAFSASVGAGEFRGASAEPSAEAPADPAGSPAEALADEMAGAAAAVSADEMAGTPATRESSAEPSVESPGGQAVQSPHQGVGRRAAADTEGEERRAEKDTEPVGNTSAVGGPGSAERSEEVEGSEAVGNSMAVGSSGSTERSGAVADPLLTCVARAVLARLHRAAATGRRAAAAGRDGAHAAAVRARQVYDSVAAPAVQRGRDRVALWGVTTGESCRAWAHLLRCRAVSLSARARAHAVASPGRARDFAARAARAAAHAAQALLSRRWAEMRASAASRRREVRRWLQRDPSVSRILGLHGQGRWYALMRVRRSASKKKLKEAYRRLAKRVHPDKTADERAGKAFNALRDTFDLLTDEQKRKAYDAQLAREDWKAVQRRREQRAVAARAARTAVLQLGALTLTHRRVTLGLILAGAVLMRMPAAEPPSEI